MSSEPVSSTTAASQPVSAAEKSTTTEIQASESKPVLADKPVDAAGSSTSADKPIVSDKVSTSESKTETETKPIETTPAPVKPLAQLFKLLPVSIAESGHNEMWGVDLLNEKHVPTTIVLEKFLRANNNDPEKAKNQLTEALKWRKANKPAQLLDEVKHDAAKFSGLGYVTIYPKTETHEKEIVTWNIYGAAKNIKVSFGDVEEFIRWRVALMEISVRELNLAAATVPIPEGGEDPYRMIQVHDYLNVSFLRADPAVKASSKETIRVFSLAYPELLKEKFFVNVPLVMGWFFTAMKLFLSPATVKKFHPLSYGSSLAGELKSFGSELPAEYGGQGKDIKEGLTVKYAEVAEKKPVEDAKATGEPVSTDSKA